MAFERFTQVGKSFKPVVSIWMRGQVGFNQGAVNVAGIKEGSLVVFFFDKDDERIGFKFTTDDSEEGALKIKVLPTGAMVSAKSFLDFYQIDHKRTRKYDFSFDHDAGMFVLDLKGGRIGKDEE